MEFVRTKDEMYICNTCNGTFSEPYCVYDRDTGWTEAACPYCGDDNFEPAHTCLRCGELIPESQAEFNLCDDCEKEILDEFDEFMERFGEDEKELIIWRGII